MRIKRELCSLLVIDIQERLYPHMADAELLLEKTKLLLEGLRILQVPLLLSEQYPRGLGSTLKAILDAAGNPHPSEKISFSCCDDAAIWESIDNPARPNVILCGIEAHVCVMQTAIDLIDGGLLPVIVADAISSRNLDDKKIALDRMRQEGAVITSCESILFELARVAGTEEFKAISKLVK